MDNKKNNNVERTEMPQKQIKKAHLPRVVAVDFGRGFGMFIILTLHLFIFWGFNSGGLVTSQNYGAQPIWARLVSVPFQFLGSWASIFALLTGVSSTYIMHYQIQEKNIDIKTRLLKSLMNGIVLLGINVIYIYFFTYPSRNIIGDDFLGMIPASIKAGKWVVPDETIFFIASPLSMIAFSNFFIVLICGIMWRKGIDENRMKLYFTVFAVLGAFFVFFAEPLKNILFPIMEQQYNEKNFLTSMLMAWLIGPKLSVFPYVGFAFFGAMYGFFIRQESFKMKNMTKLGLSIAVFAFVVAFIHGFIKGFPDIETIYNATYFPFFAYVLNLGLQNVVAVVCFKTWDTIPIEKRRGRIRYNTILSLQRMSTISLTIFMLEETTASLYTQLTLWLAPIFLENLALNLFIWGPLYVYIWFVLINMWDKHYQLKYSLEWFLTALMRKKSIKSDEDLLNTKKIIYESRGYKDKEDYYTWKEMNERQK